MRMRIQSVVGRRLRLTDTCIPPPPPHTHQHVSTQVHELLGPEVRS